MSQGLVAVEATDSVFRLGRAPDAWAWPDWAYATGLTFGNRWDDPLGEYRVLYGCSQRLGVFVETLARFRPDLAVVAGLNEIQGEDDGPSAGVVPSHWLADRLIGQAQLPGRFVDVGHAETIATLRSVAAAEAIRFGLEEIDASTIRLSAPRGFTQAISRLVYEWRGDGAPFAGIRYRSRLGDDLVNWAIFESPAGTSPIPLTGGEVIDSDDSDLLAAVALLELRLDRP